MHRAAKPRTSRTACARERKRDLQLGRFDGLLLGPLGAQMANGAAQMIQPLIAGYARDHGLPPRYILSLSAAFVATVPYLETRITSPFWAVLYGEPSTTALQMAKEALCVVQMALEAKSCGRCDGCRQEPLTSLGQLPVVAGMNVSETAWRAHCYHLAIAPRNPGLG